jgi:hypothetical protein
VEANPDGLVTISEKGPTPTSHWRRSVYVRSLRGSHPLGQGFKLSMLEIFDFPEIVINCTRRTNSTTPLQSLALVNSKFMREQAQYFADRVRASVEDTAPARKLIEMAFGLALGRQPEPAELQFCEDFLSAQTQVYLNENQNAEESAKQALASLCLMLLASNEFLYSG